MVTLDTKCEHPIAASAAAKCQDAKWPGVAVASDILNSLTCVCHGEKKLDNLRNFHPPATVFVFICVCDTHTQKLLLLPEDVNEDKKLAVGV